MVSADRLTYGWVRTVGNNGSAREVCEGNHAHGRESLSILLEETLIPKNTLAEEEDSARVQPMRTFFKIFLTHPKGTFTIVKLLLIENFAQVEDDCKNLFQLEFYFGHICPHAPATDIQNKKANGYVLLSLFIKYKVYGISVTATGILYSWIQSHEIEVYATIV